MAFTLSFRRCRSTDCTGQREGADIKAASCHLARECCRAHLCRNDAGLVLQVVLQLAGLLRHCSQLAHQHLARLCQSPVKQSKAELIESRRREQAPSGSSRFKAVNRNS
jgi:hypothetical protein